jgi:hypothetical protein
MPVCSNRLGCEFVARRQLQPKSRSSEYTLPRNLPDNPRRHTGSRLAVPHCLTSVSLLPQDNCPPRFTPRRRQHSIRPKRATVFSVAEFRWIADLETQTIGSGEKCILVYIQEPVLSAIQGSVQYLPSRHCSRFQFLHGVMHAGHPPPPFGLLARRHPPPAQHFQPRINRKFRHRIRRACAAATLSVQNKRLPSPAPPPPN